MFTKRDLLWNSPIYKFRVPNVEDENLQEVVIDVTRSAPSYGGPSKALQTTLNEIFSNKEYGRINTVLEFGARKLRTTIQLLTEVKML